MIIRAVKTHGCIMVWYSEVFCVSIPLENNGTKTWADYQAWLDAGNAPEIGEGQPGT
jgi:hypothetical protein